VYASFRYYPGGSSEFADLLVENEEAVRSLISEIDGFRAYYLVRTEDSSAVSVSVFDDKSGADRSNEAAGAWVRENAGDLAVSPQVSGGEVAINF
jgi:heme-degrading monooxygenase HmoA